jgi:hypothetical protein
MYILRKSPTYYELFHEGKLIISGLFETVTVVMEEIVKTFPPCKTYDNDGNLVSE